MLKLLNKELMELIGMEGYCGFVLPHMQPLSKSWTLVLWLQMSCYIQRSPSLVMWSEQLLSVMIGEDQRAMVLLNFPEETLLKQHCSKLMMDYSFLEGIVE